jgi:hypothetical protein
MQQMSNPANLKSVGIGETLALERQTRCKRSGLYPAAETSHPSSTFPP